MTNEIIKVLDIASKNINSIDFSDRYQYDGRCVPRVTEILSAMLHEDYIVQWANSLGFKRKGYRATLREAAEKGTYTHLSIENFLKKGLEPNYEEIPYLAQGTVKNTFPAFKSWWDIINATNEIDVLGIEDHLTCKYFGGTLDCLLKINGKVWLIDFKSSNHMSYKYCLQMAAYAYMLKETRGIEIDGCLVLMLNKQAPVFQEQILDLSNEYHKQFFENCKMEFLSLVVAYYGRLQIESQYKEIF